MPRGLLGCSSMYRLLENAPKMYLARDSAESLDNSLSGGVIEAERKVRFYKSSASIEQ